MMRSPFRAVPGSKISGLWSRLLGLTLVCD
jgi:hypothetical protein